MEMHSDKLGLIFRAIPDSGSVRLMPNGKQGVKPILPNCIVIPTEIIADVRTQASIYWYPTRTQLLLDKIDWVVNICADADEYANSLEALDEEFAGRNIPIFNHPKSILATRRDMNSERLKGIPNLVVPKCVRFLANKPEIFLDTFESHGFDYPVLVRPTKSQTGRNLVKIGHADDWGKVHSIPWGGTHMYMTQFVEYADGNGIYRQLRMAYTNGKFFFKTMRERQSWMVHGDIRTKDSVKKELQAHEYLSNNTAFNEMLDRIGEIVNLDFWGIDLGYLPNGKFLFFEANAAMSITTNTQTPADLMEMMAPIKVPIVKNLHTSILSPKSWQSVS